MSVILVLGFLSGSGLGLAWAFGRKPSEVR